MVQRYHNPFAGIDLLVPIEQRDVYDRYCQTGSRLDIDESPFPRMIDLWFTGFSMAVRNKLKYIDLTRRETFKFNDGSVFGSDSWRVNSIMLVAMTISNDIEILTQPNQMISIANGLAAVGVPQLHDMLRGDQPPIWNLSDELDELLN